MTGATLADPEQVRRALLASLAAIRCKCLHTQRFVERGVCRACETWANAGAAKTVARWIFRAAGCRTRIAADGRWTVQASADQYDQVGRQLEQLARLAQGEDPDAPPGAA